MLLEVAVENAFDKAAKLHEFVELRRLTKIAVRAKSFEELLVVFRC